MRKKKNVTENVPFENLLFSVRLFFPDFVLFSSDVNSVASVSGFVELGHTVD